MASPRLAGIRQPGFHIAGAPIGGGGGGGGGPTTAALTTLADAGDFYAATEVEGALNEVGNSIFGLTFQMTAKADLSTLASHAAGAGASKVGIQDAANLITGTNVETALAELAYNLNNLTGTIPLTQGGTGQITAAAAFDALTVTAPALTSAPTLDLSLASCPGHYAVVNGATGPITSLGTAPAGTERILRFASTPTLTHNAASLILPGAADIVAAAGDVMFLHSLGSGNWRCTSYTRAASLPAYAGDLAALTAGKGGSLIGLQDAGGYFATKNAEAALQQLGPLVGGAFGSALSATVTDTGTNTTPDLFLVRHTTSATMAANFGGTLVTQLKGAGVDYRAGEDISKMSDVGAGTQASTRTFRLMKLNGLADVVTLGFSADYSGANFPTVGSAAAPTITVGPPGNKTGLFSNSTALTLSAGGINGISVFSTSISLSLPVGTSLGSLATPAFALGVQAGIYGVTGGIAFSGAGTNLLTLAKTATPFVFTAPVPAIANNTTATEFVGADLDMRRTSTWTAGTVTAQREVLFRAPTYAGATATAAFTTAATVAIAGPPIAGANATIANRYSLWSQDGVVAHDYVEPSGGSNTSVQDVMVLRHSFPAGAPAVGWGLTLGMDLANTTAPTPVRAVNLQPRWTNAAAGSENGTLAIQTKVGGGATLLDQAVFGTTADYSGVNVGPGTVGAPSISFGPPANKLGIYASSAGQLSFVAGGTAWLHISSGNIVTTARILTNAGGTAAAPDIQISTCSGIYPTGTGMGFCAGQYAGPWVGVLALNRTASPFLFTAPSPIAANNTLSTEFVAFDINMSRTSNWAAGNFATQREVLIRRPTYSAVAGGTVITSAATFAIDNAPTTTGGNITLTNAYAFWVQAGATRLDGNFGLGKTPVAVQNTTGTATGFTAGGAAVGDTSTFTGGTGATAYRISDIVLALKNYGLLAA